MDLVSKPTQEDCNETQSRRNVSPRQTPALPQPKLIVDF